MRTVPGAMMWEMLNRGRWQLIGGALAANAMSAIILAALQRDGALDPTNSSMITMHVVLTQVNLFIFGAAVFSAQGSPSRLFAWPVTTATIVTWHLLPAMVITGLEVLLSTAALNAIFHLGWPLWGPAMFAAVVVAAIQVSFWLTEKSAWIMFGLAIVGGALGIWFKSRYGAPFSQTEHYWLNVEPAEVATLLALAALAYAAGIVAIARNRRSEPPVSLGIMDWITSTFDLAPGVSPPLRTAVQAQFWYEWRQKGWLMPAAVVFGLLVWCCIWLLFRRNTEELFGSALFGGGLLSVVAMVVGLMMGNCGPNDGNFEIGPFFATRPLTSPDLARAILKVSACSVFAGWSIWLTAFGAMYLILLATGSLPGPESDVRDNLSWWYFPATLLGPWTIVSVLASIGLTGRTTLIAKMFCALIAVVVSLPLLSRFLLSEQEQVQLVYGVAIVSGIGFLLATIWVFVAALRRMLIGWSTISVAVSLETALVALVTLAWMQQPVAAVATYVLLIGLASLAILPLAAAPLALAWNRHR